MSAYAKDVLLQVTAEGLVNMSNRAGVMVKGATLQFKQTLPEFCADLKSGQPTPRCWTFV
jgi:hypothetical protein